MTKRFDYIYNADGSCHVWDCSKQGVILAYDDMQPEGALWFCVEHWQPYEEEGIQMLTIAEDRRGTILPEFKPLDFSDTEQDFLTHMRGLHLQMINAFAIPSQMTGDVHKVSSAQEEIDRIKSHCPPSLSLYMQDLTMRDLYTSQYAAQGKRYPPKRKINQKRLRIVQRKMAQGRYRFA